MYLFLIIVLFPLTLFLYSRVTRPKRRLPPGPSGLPLLGNILQIVKNPHLKLSQWVEQFGKLYTISLGTKQALIISDPKMIKEIFSHPASTGKFKTDTFLELSKGPYGVVNCEGEAWMEQRQFCTRTLVKYGFASKSTMEPMILGEFQEVVEWVKKESENGGRAVELQKTFNIATCNVLWTLVSGERISLEDRKVSKLITDLMEAAMNSVKTGLGFLPWLKYIAPHLSGFTELKRATGEIHGFIEQEIDTHKKTLVAGAPRDLIDSYIEQVNQTTDSRSSFYGSTGEKNSVASIVELFLAGGETTSHTVNWLVLYLAHHQDVQSKLHAEIDNVIGKFREPSYADKQKMPYTEAVIQEVLRITSLVPNGLIHQLVDDIVMYGYEFPKGLLLMANMYHVHHDKEIWGDPEIFRPERFIMNVEGSEDIKVVKSDALMPFQTGRRQCLGEHLARDMLFLFVTKLFQSLHFLPDPDNPVPNYEPDVGVALIAKPFKVKIRVRTSDK